MFSHYPNEFVKEYTNFQLRLTKIIETKDVLEKQYLLSGAAYDLMEWAKKLPVANRLIVGFYQHLDCTKDEFIERIHENLDCVQNEFIKTVENTLGLCVASIEPWEEGMAYFSFDTITTPEKKDAIITKIRAFADEKLFLYEIEVEECETRFQ